MSPKNDQEEALVKFVSRLEHRCIGYQALHVHFSKLQPQNRADSVTRVSESLLRRLVTTYDDQLFRLTNNDMILVCRGKQVKDVRGVLGRIQALVKRDPLFAGGDEEAANGFGTWNDLSVSWSEFMTRTEVLLDQMLSTKESKGKGKGKEDDEEEAKPADPMDAARLGRLEASLKSVDLSNFIRRQQVCAIAGTHAPQPVFEELFISVADLRRVTMPDVDLLANPTLFQQLTNTFDYRMIAALHKTGQLGASLPFSINLNIATVMSSEFIKFVERVRRNDSSTFIVEFQVGDVFTNMKDFMFARDFSRESGFRICLDALSHASLTLIDFTRLDLALYKLFWDTEIDGLPESSLDDMKDAVKAAGPERMILSRCDRPHAVPFGRGLGIGLFQGWRIDSALRPKTV
ncbi:MAG: hypothetical protein QF926_07780 [Alphaproteobacteria bacterium]|nr:hypothetical protein [Alphaproteobacteria bacterium]MDP6516506.1 hypothetical protein [Alphaproteobacteria bacterium]